MIKSLLMLSITHIMISGAIAVHSPNWIWAIGLIGSTHFFMDAVPHYDLGTDALLEAKRSQLKTIALEIAELVIGFSLLYLSLAELHKSLILIGLTGGFVGILPDLISAPSNFFNLKFSFLKQFNQFHDRFHGITSDVILGLLPQLILVVLAWLSLSPLLVN